MARYSHRVAITNHRIKSIDKGVVVFEYKDYTDRALKMTMSLPTHEFIQRFCLHILKSGFRKRRHYGLTSNASKLKDINKARLALGHKMVLLLDRKEQKSKLLQDYLVSKVSFVIIVILDTSTHSNQNKETKPPPFQSNPFEQFNNQSISTNMPWLCYAQNEQNQL